MNKPTFARFARMAGLLVVVAVVIAACSGGTGQQPQPTTPPSTAIPTQPPAPTVAPATSVANVPQDGAVLPWLSVYFSDPFPPDETNRGLDRWPVADIDKAARTIDAAFFDLNAPSVINALIAAQRRGVKVRLVVDLENGSQQVTAARGRPAYDALAAIQNAKLPYVDGGRSNGLMHEKILIIDGTILYIGSWNASWNDSYRNNNNLLRITAQRLIQNYQSHFNDMYERQLFGTRNKNTVANPTMTLDGVRVENYFSPPDKVMEKILREVGAAQKSIRFMAFTFTHPELRQLMLDKAKAKVLVQGVFENRGALQGAMPFLFCGGLQVRTDGNPYTMHHKVIIIDDSVVITGSYNYTATADRANDEGIVIIRSQPVAALYLDEFIKVYQRGEQPDSVVCANGQPVTGAVPTARPGRPTPTPQGVVCPDIEATCSQLTCEQALACLRAGNSNLDRNNDGFPCDSQCKGKFGN